MKHLYIIAGHGAGDPGACGNGYQEAERVRALAQRIKDFGGDDVTLHPFSDNAYKSGAINHLDIPKDWAIAELHMDSAAASARGGHVIIKEGYSADEYDKALAKLMGDIFPGRSQTIVKRSNLANVNRAGGRGYNFRIVENGFISNKKDVEIFNARIDDLAKGYLAAFDIPEGDAPVAKKEEAPVQAKPVESSRYDEWVARLQKECNKQGFSNQKVDGIPGPITLAGCPTLKKGAEGNITGLMQERLNSLGFNCGNVDKDFGPKTQAAVKKFQKAHGLKQDGIVGPLTWNELIYA